MHGTKMLQDSDRSCPTASLAVTALASRLTGVIQERRNERRAGTVVSPARKSAVLSEMRAWEWGRARQTDSGPRSQLLFQGCFQFLAIFAIWIRTVRRS